MLPNKDNWDQVVNGSDTYRFVAERLRQRGAVALGWSDGEATHFDVLFTLAPGSSGGLYYGQRGSDLFISIARKGCFGFEVSGPKHAGYYAEKLGLTAAAKDCAGITELVNNVIAELIR